MELESSSQARPNPESIHTAYGAVGRKALWVQVPPTGDSRGGISRRDRCEERFQHLRAALIQLEN